jgi:hypothetical protein
MAYILGYYGMLCYSCELNLVFDVHKSLVRATVGKNAHGVRRRQIEREPDLMLEKVI